MSLMEILTMQQVLVSAAALVVSIVSVTFTIPWMLSHDDKKDNDKKKK